LCESFTSSILKNSKIRPKKNPTPDCRFNDFIIDLRLEIAVGLPHGKFQGDKKLETRAKTIINLQGHRVRYTIMH